MQASRDVDLFMLLTDPRHIGLCPDTAQFAVAGSDPIANLKAIKRYVENTAGYISR